MSIKSGLAAFIGFDPNHWVIYLMYALIVAFISAEAIFYLIKSYKKAKEIGMDMTKIKKVIKTSASFSILPAIGIGIGVVTLVGALGIAFPAIRLSVIGALQYETQMADGAATALTSYKYTDPTTGDILTHDGSMVEMLQSGVTPEAFATMALLMTISIILGPILVVCFYKKLQPMLARLGNMQVGGSKDPEGVTKSLEQDVKKKSPSSINLGDLVFQISFIGMIIGYLSWSVAAIAGAPKNLASYYNFIAVIISAGFMVLCDFLIKKFKWKWLDDFSTAFSMLLAMLVVAVIAGTTGIVK